MIYFYRVVVFSCSIIYFKGAVFISAIFAAAVGALVGALLEKPASQGINP